MSTEVSRGSHTQKAPHMGLPHSDPVRRQRNVNVAPIGHEFAMFQMNDLSKDNSFSDTDLNQGGKYSVYPRGWGREYMRGPYTVETEGLPGGEGGEAPVATPGGQDIVSPFYLGAEWQGWHLIPTPRAGVPKRAYLVGGSLVTTGFLPLMSMR